MKSVDLIAHIGELDDSDLHDFKQKFKALVDWRDENRPWTDTRWSSMIRADSSLTSERIWKAGSDIVAGVECKKNHKQWLLEKFDLKSTDLEWSTVGSLPGGPATYQPVKIRMILLDTSLWVELYRKKIKKKTLFYRLAEYETNFSISSVTHYEIGIGNKSTTDPYWETLYNSLVVILFDKACSLTAIDIYLDLKKKSKLIDLADLLIGATAITYQYPIATLNRKHFERIPGIDIIGLNELN